MHWEKQHSFCEMLRPYCFADYGPAQLLEQHGLHLTERTNITRHIRMRRYEDDEKYDPQNQLNFVESDGTNHPAKEVDGENTPVLEYLLGCRRGSGEAVE